MIELTTKVKDKLNERYEQLNQNVDKISKAGKGLFSKLRDLSTEQFNELVSTGEKTDAAIFAQVAESVKQPLTDIRGSVNKAKFASVGLMVKVRENSNKYFEELVLVGQKADKPSKAEKTDSSKSKGKTATKAAA